MFKIAAHPIMAGSILCALQAATGPPASALDQWVELTNNTRMTIVEIYISHVGAQLWDIDLLGTDFLAPASSVWTSIDDAAAVDLTSKPSSTMGPPRSGGMSMRAV